MSAEVETMAYRKEGGIPWHWQGKPVNNDMTPEQMMNASGTDWKVFKAPLYAHVSETEHVLYKGRSALMRSTDHSILDAVGGEDWHSIQNIEAFSFFKEYVEAGQMQMETAGSLRKGQIVWVLARIKEKFELFGGDVVQGFILFTNHHAYGQSRDVRFTPIRVVCQNTLWAALAGKTDRVFRAPHRVKVTAEMIQETLGLVTKSMSQYKDLVSFLGSKEYDDENLIEFFNQVFPTNSVKGDASRNAVKALQCVTTQPGAEFARNTWWQAVNAVTYLTDHEMGNTADNRTYNVLYGLEKDRKIKAMRMAAEYASRG